MRYAFFITIFALLQLFSVGAALSVQWWLQPWQTAGLQTSVWVIIFVITNALLLLSVNRAFANSYRWIDQWLDVGHALYAIDGFSYQPILWWLLANHIANQ